MAEGGFGWWSALKWVWSNKTEVLAQVARVRAWFRSDPGRGILIIGAGGVGKTTLAAILSDEFDWLTSDPWEYQESYGIEEYALSDDPRTRIVVAPGQTIRRAATWPDLERDVTNGKYRGVILVGAFGYHSLLRGSYKDHELFAGRREEFLIAFLNECRRDELAIQQRIASALVNAPGKMWVLTVVTKEDLWDAERPEADRFYTGGECATVFAPVLATKGATTFRQERVATSLVISNFTTGLGEVLRQNTAGYDHRRSVESVRRIQEVLDALRAWEAQT